MRRSKAASASAASVTSAPRLARGAPATARAVLSKASHRPARKSGTRCRRVSRPTVPGSGGRWSSHRRASRDSSTCAFAERRCHGCRLLARLARRGQTNARRGPARKNAGTLCMVGTGVRLGGMQNSAARSTTSKLDHAEAGLSARAELLVFCCVRPAAMLSSAGRSASSKGSSAARAPCTPVRQTRGLEGPAHDMEVSGTACGFPRRFGPAAVLLVWLPESRGPLPAPRSRATSQSVIQRRESAKPQARDQRHPPTLNRRRPENWTRPFWRVYNLLLAGGLSQIQI